MHSSVQERICHRQTKNFCAHEIKCFHSTHDMFVCLQEDFLATDDLFVEYFNIFLSLPVSSFLFWALKMVSTMLED